MRIVRNRCGSGGTSRQAKLDHGGNGAALDLDGGLAVASSLAGHSTWSHLSWTDVLARGLSSYTLYELTHSLNIPESALFPL